MGKPEGKNHDIKVDLKLVGKVWAGGTWFMTGRSSGLLLQTAAALI